MPSFTFRRSRTKVNKPTRLHVWSPGFRRWAELPSGANSVGQLPTIQRNSKQFQANETKAKFPATPLDTVRHAMTRLKSSRLGKRLGSGNDWRLPKPLLRILQKSIHSFRYDPSAGSGSLFHGKSRQTDRHWRLYRPNGTRDWRGGFPDESLSHYPRRTKQRPARQSAACAPEPKRPDDRADLSGDDQSCFRCLAGNKMIIRERRRA